MRAFFRRCLNYGGSSLLLVAMVSWMACRPGPAWVELGPRDRSGRLSAVLADEADPDRLLVASPGGGVWRTANGGALWEEASQGLVDLNVMGLERDLVRVGRIYAISTSALHYSTDFGSTWATMQMPANAGPLEHWATRAPPDPAPFAQMELTGGKDVIFWARACDGIYYSTDGRTLQHHLPFAAARGFADNCVVSIAADQIAKRFYLSSQGGLRGPANGAAFPPVTYRSSCSWTATSPCLSWEYSVTGLPTSVNPLVLGRLLWTGVADQLLGWFQNNGTHVYRTNDGRTWSLAGSLPNPSWAARSWIHPGGRQLFFGTVLGYQSQDLGATWTELAPTGSVPVQGRVGDIHPDVRAFDQRAYSNPARSYLWQTTDGGLPKEVGRRDTAVLVRWDWKLGDARPTSPRWIDFQGLSTWQAFWARAVRTAAGGVRLFAGSMDNGAICSDDGGKNWSRRGAPAGQPYSGSASGDLYSAHFASSDPNRGYSRSGASEVLERTSNAARAARCADVRWEASPQPPPSGSIQVPSPIPAENSDLLGPNSLAVHPRDPARVYLASGDRLWISDDGWNTARVSLLPKNAHPITIFADAAGELYAGTIGSGAFHSPDEGRRWFDLGVPKGGATTAVLAVRWHTAVSGAKTLLVATSGGIYRRPPGGSWQRTFGDDTTVVSDLLIDPVCNRRQFAAIGVGMQFGQQPGGVVVSVDDGLTWTRSTTGVALDRAPVTSLEMIRVGTVPTLLAASFGRGVWSTVLPTGCP